MSIYKPRLSRGEKAMRLNYLRQLQAEGHDVDIPQEWQENSRALDIILASFAASTVCEFATGGIGYAIFVRLIARLG
jgi:hypothetical protein